MSSTTLAGVFELLLRAPTLRRLDLSAVHVHARRQVQRDEVTRLLNVVMNANHTLRSLRVARCERLEANRELVQLLVRASGGASSLSNKLMSLSMSAAALDVSWLHPLLGCAAALRRLSLRDLQVPSELASLLHALGQCETNASLALRFDRANLEHVEALPALLRNRLTSLRLIDARHVSAAITCWQTAALPLLRFLDLSSSDLTDDALSVLAIACPSLRV